LPLVLIDDWGQPLASGLYYVALTVQGKKAVAKLVLAP